MKKYADDVTTNALNEMQRGSVLHNHEPDLKQLQDLRVVIDITRQALRVAASKSGTPSDKQRMDRLWQKLQDLMREVDELYDRVDQY